MFANLAPVTPAHPAFNGATVLTALLMVALVALTARHLLRSTCRVPGCHVTRDAPTLDALEARRARHYRDAHLEPRVPCGACRMGRHPERPHRLDSSTQRCGCACAEPDRAAYLAHLADR